MHGDLQGPWSHSGSGRDLERWSLVLSQRTTPFLTTQDIKYWNFNEVWPLPDNWYDALTEYPSILSSPKIICCFLLVVSLARPARYLSIVLQIVYWLPVTSEVSQVPCIYIVFCLLFSIETIAMNLYHTYLVDCELWLSVIFHFNQDCLDILMAVSVRLLTLPF